MLSSLEKGERGQGGTFGYAVPSIDLECEKLELAAGAYRMKVSSRVTGVTCRNEIVPGSRHHCEPDRSSGAGANCLEVIANGLGVIRNGLELGAQGRRYEVDWFGSPRKWFGTDRAGEGDRDPGVWN